MMGVNCHDSTFPEFAEVDPTKRYGRYNDVLGKGASKTVYKAFDEYEGIEVAWNQVKLHDFLHCPEDLERLYCEIHLLKTLKHKNIMKFYTSWVDTNKMNINFITEMFTSGTLRQYRQRHRRVNIRAVKHWCRQILSGLLYLHSHCPPIIHRDLKCDNILINGNTGEVKIGDLGLAAILRKSHEVHCVGTPEFMAPEVYEEEYNELVDIYSFGMCVLEMVTFEYPYSECTHPAQIYKKVVSGTKPESLNRVEDPEVREFIEKCLAKASRRLSARELLNDPFLQTDAGCVKEEVCSMGLIFSQPSLPFSECTDTSMTSSSNVNEMEWENDLDCDFSGTEANCMDLFSTCENEHDLNVDITIKGKKREDGTIFLRLRISDKDGCMRNIYFPFDLEADTALSVATEMVAELDLTDYEATKIADMINGEVYSLVPEWKPGHGIENTAGVPTSNLCKNCSSDFPSFSSLNNSVFPGLQSINCVCAEIHGRFAETTYQVDKPESFVTEEVLKLSTSQSGQIFGSPDSRGDEFDEGRIHTKHVTKEENSSRTELDNAFVSTEGQENRKNTDGRERNTYRDPKLPSPRPQTKLQRCRSRQLERSSRIFHQSVDLSNGEHAELAADNEVLDIVTSIKPQKSLDSKLKSFHLSRNYSYRIPESNAGSDTTTMTSPTEVC